jgi:hypothetical protein
MRMTAGPCGASHQSKRRADQGTSQLSRATLTTLPMNKASQNGKQWLLYQRPEHKHHRIEHHQNQHVHLPSRGRRSAVRDLEPLVEAGAHDPGVKLLGERLRLLQETEPTGEFIQT